MSTLSLSLLIEECLLHVHHMASLIAGEPDEVAEAVLAGICAGLEDSVPPETLDALVGAVRRCKAGIEGGAAISVLRH